MSETNTFSSMTNEELLLEYSKTKDPKLKEELTLRYIPLVRQIAKRMWNVYAGFSQLDDIIHEGVFVIMSALDRFDVEKNVKFQSFVAKRLRGMVIDLAREQDWLSRGSRKLAKDITAASDRLCERFERAPTDEEIAKELNITPKRYYEELQRIDLFNVVSLDVVMEESEDNTWRGAVPRGGEESEPEKQFLDTELKEHLKDGIKGLGEKEKLVISLYYEQELSIKEIAKILNVSKPRVSQIHTAAIKKLRNHMELF